MKQPQSDILPLSQTPNLGALFRERVRHNPDKIAYTEFDQASETWNGWSWRQTADQVARWQAAMLRDGLQPGERVAIMLRNCRAWVLFDQAAQGLGLVTVPIYTNDRAENIGYILQDSGARMLLIENQQQWQDLRAIEDQLAGMLRVLTLERIEITSLQTRVTSVEEWLQGVEGELQTRNVDSHAMATIVYTSGTTGRPKGVMLSHHNILYNVQAAFKVIEIFPDDEFLSFLPLSHAFERTCGYYLPMAAGSAVSYARSIPQLAEDLVQIRPTVLISVPRIFERVYAKIQAKLEQDQAIARKLFRLAVAVGWRTFEHQQGRAGWSPSLLLWPLLEKLVAGKVQAKLGGRLRVAVSGGAPLSAEVAKLFVGLGVPVVQGYGLTEISPIVTGNSLENNIPDSIGMALPGVEVRIGEADELLTRSPSVMLGYWNNPEATGNTIDADGWLHTGDRARKQGDHYFITGRLKEIIVLANGEKVPPADMEMAIALDGLFEQVMVIGEGKPFLTALVVLNPERYQTLAEELGLDPLLPASLQDPRLQQALVERIGQQLHSFPGYAQLYRVAVLNEPWTVENSLLTPTLKLRRSRIVDRYGERVAELYSGH